MFYYLEWCNKRPSNILFTNIKPDKINYTVDFKVNKEIYTLCGYINPEFKDYLFPNKLSYTKNQYLLSHLQKSIRRMKPELSVKTAKHLLDLDINSFIRRLPIIMIEDVTIHGSFPIIIWLMIAISKNFKIKNVMVQWLFGIVYYLSTCNIKTHYKKDNFINKYNGNHDNFHILHSLSIRIAYGGMKGDMNMIRYYINHILNNEIKIDYNKISIIKLDIKPLQKYEWMYQANDFHCNRSIPKQIVSYHPEYKEEYIKELIWKCRSCKNKREIFKIHEIYKQDWLQIKKNVSIVQKKCIYY
jgi:hypothetical protein